MIHEVLMGICPGKIIKINLVAYFLFGCDLSYLYYLVDGVLPTHCQISYRVFDGPCALPFAAPELSHAPQTLGKPMVVREKGLEISTG